MKFDLHTHHDRCGHARGHIRDYIESAIDKGLDIIGISDHSPFFASDQDAAQPSIAMAKSEFPEYVKEVLALKKEFEGRIEVLLGMESDFFPEHTDLYKRQYNKYPFDYLIGSVHKSGTYSIFDRRRWEHVDNDSLLQQKEEYYHLIGQSARSGLFQILGHIDALKGYFPAISDIPTPEVDKALKIIGECDLTIEVNTSGKMKDCGKWYPTDAILERALYYGVSVTFGSDAHDAERVADEREQVRLKLKDIGFKQWAFFRRKVRMYIDL